LPFWAGYLTVLPSRSSNRTPSSKTFLLRGTNRTLENVPGSLQAKKAIKNELNVRNFLAFGQLCLSFSFSLPGWSSKNGLTSEHRATAINPHINLKTSETGRHTQGLQTPLPAASIDWIELETNAPAAK
jgi:hypothetical protein